MVYMLIGILLVGTFELLAFLLGVRTAQKLIKGEVVELPNMNPIKAYQDAKIEHQIKQQELKEQEELNKVMTNIDNYDGTSLGQIDL